MKKLNLLMAASLVLAMASTSLTACTTNSAAPKKAPTTAAAAKFSGKTFKVGVSIYTGWMPHYYENRVGILQAWAKKEGVKIELVPMDYGPSIDAYSAGQLDALVITNMDALIAPCASGIDSTVVLMGDYSNGNDAILVRNGLTIKDLPGQSVSLCEKTVSEYVLHRALELNHVAESKSKHVTTVNVSDATIASTFMSQPDQKACVTWNPMVLTISQAPGVTKIFDSSKIPGEVQDLCVVRTSDLKDAQGKENPEGTAFARAITGAWYETMDIMSTPGATKDKAIKDMADLSKCSVDDFNAQLKTTRMYYTPASAVVFTESKEIQEKNDLVRHFCFDHHLLGGAKSVDDVGISYPDGTVQGDKAHVMLRYDSRFMQEALTKSADDIVQQTITVLGKDQDSK